MTMPKRLLLTLIVMGTATLFLCSTVQAQHNSSALPKFAHYPVEIYHGPKAPLQLTTKDGDFRDSYLQAYDQAPNFAGHYIVDFGNCGTGCISIWFFDVKLGRRFHFGVGYDGPYEACPEEYEAAKKDMDRQLGIESTGDAYRLQSRLYVLDYFMLKGRRCVRRFYEEKSGRMKLIRQINLAKAQ
jgi:hypothetical protein